MKKKAFLLLLPLTLAMVSCGKNLDPKVDKVDLVRLLEDEEISEVFKKVNDNFNNLVSKIEVNYALIEDDLIDQRSETTVSGSVVIKGNDYSESKAELVTKVKNNFYTYTTKTVTESKTAAFGDYYISMTESIQDDQKDNKSTMIDYEDKDDSNVVKATMTLPFTASSVTDATFGVDRGNNVYAVYNRETVNTTEGRDKDGKDASFIDKETYEIYAKLGNLKDPKIESFKTVRLYEANYDEELKIYKDYQTVRSYVMSYKFEYKNRGNNAGMDKFIDSLPDKYVSYASGTMNRYSKENSNSYIIDNGSYLSLSSFNSASYSDDLYTFKASNVNFMKDYAYNFVASYSELSINKSTREIITTQKEIKSSNVYGSNDVENFTGYVGGQATNLLRVKEGKSSSVNTVHFVIDANNATLTVYVI